MLDAVRRGDAPVVVVLARSAARPIRTRPTRSRRCSARCASGPNRDLLLACGEAISCAVFAELLSVARSAGAGDDRRASRHHHRRRLRRRARSSRSIRSRCARCSSAASSRSSPASKAARATARRRRSAAAAAISPRSRSATRSGARSVEIFTDVTGVMTADPRRVAGAHPIDRVDAGRDGRARRQRREGDAPQGRRARARDAHAVRRSRVCAAASARRSTTTRRSTRDRPVTGLTVDPRRHVLPRSSKALTDDARPRRRSTATCSARVAERGISIDMVNVNDAGVFFIVDDEHGGRGAAGARRPQPRAAHAPALREALDRRRRDARHVRASCTASCKAVTDAGVEIIHSTDSNITISILVPADAGARAEQALHDTFRLGRGAVAR